MRTDFVHHDRHPHIDRVAGKAESVLQRDFDALLLGIPGADFGLRCPVEGLGIIENVSAEERTETVLSKFLVRI